MGFVKLDHAVATPCCGNGCWEG